MKHLLDPEKKKLFKTFLHLGDPVVIIPMILLHLVRKLSVLEMGLCSQAIVIGALGGGISFYTAIKYIQ